MSTTKVENGAQSPWECLGTAMRELTACSSREEINNTVERAAQQLCEAHSVFLRQGIPSATDPTADDAAASATQGTSITIAAGAGPNDALMTVVWKSPHEVSDLDREL